MQTSVRWINDYLIPPATAGEIADGLTRAGFPLDGQEEIAGDICLEIETTSNRGDCLCHIGLARELAAMTGRTLKGAGAAKKAASAGSPSVASLAAVENREPAACPLYTARIIRGVKIGPSPSWLADRLRAIGQIPRNNVVDATNFVLFELGQPTHVFDLAKLKGSKITVRKAARDEPFLPLGEGAQPIKLTADDLVIADAEHAVALAGVKGGALTAVTEATTDLLLEAATFSPVAVRLTSRRHRISSDSSYRFERGVHPATVNAAADRLAEIILQVAGGTLAEGVIAAGAPLPAVREIPLRPKRCREIIGLPIPDDAIVSHLTNLGFGVQRRGESLSCSVPAERLDIEREIDLIEEVCRMNGLDSLPVNDSIPVRVSPAQPRVAARRDVKNLLVGLGFIECVTHSLVADASAALFLPEGTSPLQIEDERSRADRALRPSIIPSLLRVRRHNQDSSSASLKLFEMASTFRPEGPSHSEEERLGLLMDAGGSNGADASRFRELRGVIERLAHELGGPKVELEVEPCPPHAIDRPRWLAPAAHIMANGATIGVMGQMKREVRDAFGLEDSFVAAELSLAVFYDKYPPVTAVEPLAGHPSIERDISVIVAESVSWKSVQSLVDSHKLTHLETTEFVTTYRGKQIGSGRKSLTLRLRFRAADRTLRHDEIDASMKEILDSLRSQLNAEIRT